MEFILLELDEDRMLRDNIINLDSAKKVINDTFKKYHCFVYKNEENVNIWTRHFNDDKDYEILWEIQAAFRRESWFRYYVKRWEYLETDDAITNIIIREDIIEDWATPRPDKP